MFTGPGGIVAAIIIIAIAAVVFVITVRREMN